MPHFTHHFFAFRPKSRNHDPRNAANPNTRNSQTWQSDAKVVLPTLLRVRHRLQSNTDTNTSEKWMPMAKWICLSQKLSPKSPAHEWMEECTSLSDSALYRASLSRPSKLHMVSVFTNSSAARDNRVVSWDKVQSCVAVPSSIGSQSCSCSDFCDLRESASAGRVPEHDQDRWREMTPTVMAADTASRQELSRVQSFWIGKAPRYRHVFLVTFGWCLQNHCVFGQLGEAIKDQ